MMCIRVLPEQYRPAGGVDVTDNPRLMVVLNLVGLGIVALTATALFFVLVGLRPQATSQAFRGMEIRSVVDVVLLTAAMLGLVALHVVVHEAIHGVVFWWITRTRPKFAFKLSYAYAAAPDWYIARGPFLVATLAPLVVMTLVGTVVMLSAPPAWILPVLYVVAMNAGGAVGDLLVTYRLLRLPSSSLVNDHGDRVHFFVEEGKI